MGEWRMVVPSWLPGACVRRNVIPISTMNSFSNKQFFSVYLAWRAVEEMSVARQVLESLSGSPTMPQNCPKRLP